MAITKPGSGALAQMAIDHSLSILDELRGIHAELKAMREFELGKRHFELLYGGEVTEVSPGVFSATEQPTEPIPQGYVFIPERIMAQAPEGSKLALFRNAVGISNFIEVVANIQEYANVTGGLIVEGPSTIIAQITGAKKAGAFAISVSGSLVRKTPSNVPV